MADPDDAHFGTRRRFSEAPSDSVLARKACDPSRVLDSAAVSDDCRDETSPPPDVPDFGDPGSQAELVPFLLPTFGRPDSVMDGGRIGRLEVRAASVRGRAHRTPVNADNVKRRQDEYALAPSDDQRWLVISVCDGVSAAARAHQGASIAARRSCQLIVRGLAEKETPFDLDFNDVASRTAGFLVAEAQKGSLAAASPDEPADIARIANVLGTTAVVAIVAVEPDESGSWPFIAATLAGDSSAWTLSQAGWTSLFDLKNSRKEMASNAVTPLPYVGGVATAEGALTQDLSLHVMTDGLGDPLGDGTGDVGIALTQEWQEPPGMHSFARAIDFRHRGAVDDRTCVGVWPFTVS